MITPVVVVHRLVSSGRAWLSVPPDWPVHSVLYDVDMSVRGTAVSHAGQSSRDDEGTIILYPKTKTMIT